MNDYYSASTETSNTRARSSSVNSERAAVEAAFDKLPALLALLQGRVTYAADTGSANSYAVALVNAPPAYVSGLHVVMTPANSCTGASTLNVNSLGARAIKRVDGTDPEAGDILAGVPCEFVLVGSTFYLVSAAPSDVLGAAQSSPTDATAGRLLKVGAAGVALGADVYRRSNILGAVGQSSGVPTGAVVERGSNANGEYVRLADGTQICVRVFAGAEIAAASATTWTFPAAFASTTIGLAGFPASTTKLLGAVRESLTTTALGFSVRDSADTRFQVSTYVSAIGRWF